MSLYDCIEKINVEKAVEYVSKLQQEDGSFFGDKWGMLIIYNLLVLFCFFFFNLSNWSMDILKMIRNLLKDCLRCL